jgi:hypothetical protein
VSSWRLYDTYTWNDLITDLDVDGDGIAYWEDAGSSTWTDYIGSGIGEKLVYANTDGHLYYQAEDTFNGIDFEGYRVEPILDFGDSTRKDLLEEIWFDLAIAYNFNIRVWHRVGDTVGEVREATWIELGLVSHNSPDKAVLYPAQSGKFHQTRWGTVNKKEPFRVSKITYKYAPQSTH